MKKVKILIAIILTAFCMTACASFSNMSEQDAYDIGYGLGRAASYMVR